MDRPYQQRRVREVAERSGRFDVARYLATNVKLRQESKTGEGDGAERDAAQGAYPGPQ